MKVDLRSCGVALTMLAACASEPSDMALMDEQLEVRPGIDETVARPRASCPEGLRDLSLETSREATTLIALGSDGGEYGTLFGTAAVFSPRYDVCLPPDTLSFLFMAPGDWVTTLDAPVEGGLLDVSSYDGYFAARSAPSGDVVQHPASPDLVAIGGVYGFQSAGYGSVPSSSLAIRRGHRPLHASLSINVLITPNAVAESDAAALDAAIASFEALYAGLGITVTRASVSSILDPSTTVIDHADSAAHDALFRTAIETSEGEYDALAVPLYVVREITSDTGSIYGFSSAPGGFAVTREGPVIAFDLHRERDGSIDPDFLGLTFGHELGHFLGLQHTSESDGEGQDVISDTPECTRADDVDGDEFLTVSECRDSGADLMMFWAGVGTVVTPHQISVLRANPSLRTTDD